VRARQALIVGLSSKYLFAMCVWDQTGTHMHAMSDVGVSFVTGISPDTYAPIGLRNLMSMF
jgi:hypothetical protein